MTARPLASLALAAFLSLAACVTIEDPPRPASVSALLAADTGLWADAARDKGMTIPVEPLPFVYRPVVRIMEATGEEDIVELHKAVTILNQHLPSKLQIEIDFAEASEKPNLWKEVEAGRYRGTIAVGFLPRNRWPENIRKQADKGRNVVGLGIPIIPPSSSHRIEGGFILIDPERIRKRGGAVVKTILHEFLHVFGRRHPPSRFPHTIMNHNAPPRPPAYLYPLDVAALKRL